MMDIKRKKLIYRSNYRGFKEVDLILGGFANKYMNVLSDHDIDLFEELLNCKDHDIYGWITGKIAIPDEYNTDLFDRIKSFEPIK